MEQNIHPKNLKRKDICMSMFDFLTTTSVAKQLEADAKRVEKDGLGYQRALVKSVKDFDDNQRSEVSIINTSSVDLDGEIILPSGIDHSAYDRFPMVTLEHRWDIATVGRGSIVKKTNTDVLAKTYYHDTDQALITYGQVKSGEYNAKSIGFLPLSVRWPTTRELELFPKLKSNSRIVDKWMLYEYAITKTPANPDCVIITKSQDTAKILSSLLSELKDLTIDVNELRKYLKNIS